MTIIYTATSTCSTSCTWAYTCQQRYDSPQEHVVHCEECDRTLVLERHGSSST